MTVFDFADALTPFIESLMFFMLFEAFLKRRETLPIWSYGAGGLILAALIALSNHYFQLSIVNVLIFSISALLVSFVYEGLWSQRIIAALFGVLIIGASELIVLFFMTWLFHLGIDSVMEIDEYRFLGTIVSKILGLAVCNGIRVKTNVKRYPGEKAYWLLFFFLFSGSLIAVFLIFKLTYEVDTTAYNGLAVISAIALFFGTIFALYLYERLGFQNALLRERDQYEQHLRGQLKYLDELLFKQKELRSFKHDISNQLVSLKGYFASGDNNGGLQHINSLLQLVEDTAPAIDTGNIALDAILSTKQAIAVHKGIQFDAHIRIGEQLTIDPVDLSVIFGNALDNAIEACDRLTAGEKRIVFELRQQDNTLFCQLANTAPPRQSEALSTSKSDKENHGHGFANLTASVKKYDGEPMVIWDSGWFTLSFMLFMPTATENNKDDSQDTPI